MSAPTPERVTDFDADRWRSHADGPRWLYASSGRLRAPWRLAVFGLTITVAQPIVESVVTPLFALLSRAAGERIEAYPWSTMLSVVVALVIALRSVDRLPWSRVALDATQWRPRALATGALLGSVAITLTIVVLAVTGAAHLVTMRAFGPTADLSADLGAPLSNVVWSTSSWSGTAARLAALLAPAALWEELVFRGYLWTVAEDAGGLQVARWTTAIAFGAVHLMNPGATALSTMLVTVAGLCLGLVRERTGSLAAAWLAHFAWNWMMAAVLHVPVSGLAFDTPGYRVMVSGPTWWTGGPWGPEGGVAALLVLSGALGIAARRAPRPASRPVVDAVSASADLSNEQPQPAAHASMPREASAPSRPTEIAPR